MRLVTVLVWVLPTLALGLELGQAKTRRAETLGVYRQRTVPVDSFRPNPWGLYQVHGNVLEWTEDCSNNDYNGAPSDGSAWTRGDCSRRVLRGGSWYFSPDFARSAFRVRLYSANRTNTQGFRVGRTIIP